MKRIINTTENWLLIIPLLVWVAEKTITGTSNLDVHLHDTYFVFTNISIGLVFLVLAVLPYACHQLLRNKIKPGTKILLWHVLLAAVTVTAIFIAGQFQLQNGLAGLPRRYYDYKHWSDYHIYSGAMLLVLLLLFYLLLQLWLFAYTMIKLLRK